MKQDISHKYVYRKHIRQPFKFFLGSFIYILSIFIYFTLIIFVSDKNTHSLEFLSALSFAIFPIFLGLAIGYIFLYFIMYRNLRNTFVILTDNKLIYSNGKKETSISYSDVIALKFPSIKYTGGWMKIIYGKKSIRLTVVLENIGDLIKELKEKLDSLGKSNIYKEKSLYNFYKTSSYSDFSWQRVYDNFFLIIITSIVNMVICFGVTILTPNMGTKFLIGLCGCLTILIGSVLSEIVLGIIFAKKSKTLRFSSNLVRDINSEKLIYKIIYPIIIFLQIIIMVFLILK